MHHDDRPWLAAYDPDVPPQVPLPDQSYVDLLREAFERFPERPAYHFLGRTTTFREFQNQADRFAALLRDQGCRPGDVVAVNLPNIPQYLIAHTGALLAGCAATGLSPLHTGREMAYQLRDSRARVLVTLDAIFEKRLAPLQEDLPELQTICPTGLLDFLPRWKQFLGKKIKKVPTGKIFDLPGKKVLPFMEALRLYPPDPVALKIPADAVCLIQYTGGTTGLPKGTLLTHGNITANIQQVRTWFHLETGRETILSGFPFFHLAGLMLAMTELVLAGTQILVPNPRDTDHICREMARYHPTILVNVPTLYLMLMENPRFNKLDFSRLAFCLSGASPFPVESIRALEEIVGRGKLVEVYGMTETSPLITANPHKGPKKIGTVGLPLPNTRVKLIDLETGTREVPVGEEGELIVHGPQVMKGYLNRPEETAHALRPFQGEPWMHTGDVARRDEEGYLTIVDRAKDMLNVGGFKVFSREVEEKLYDHPAIELCAIVGVPNPQRPGSELVKLVVQKASAARDRPEEMLKKEILDFARETLSPYKVPKFIEFVEALPLTPVGKVDKKALRAPAP
jgi:acyl-CoA synthetase (AMP-forming)/AMP-acid ligase II